MNIKLKDCTIIAIDGGSVDVTPSCPTCWGGDEWDDYVEVCYTKGYNEWTNTYNELPITEFLDMLFDLIDSKEINSLTHEEFETKIDDLKEL